MIDIEKLENLPQKQGRKAFLVERHGNLYNLKRFDHPWHRSLKEDNQWCMTERVIQNNIGKSFDMTFSYFCKKYPIYWQSYFLKQFGLNRSGYGYYVDEQGNIQENKYIKRKNLICIQSSDYKTELRHKVTGDKKEYFTEVYEQIIKEYPKCKSLPSKVYKHFNKIGTYTTNGKFLYYEYGTDPLRLKPVYKRYTAQESDFEHVVISGWIKYFESKNDPEYKRLMTESIKKSKKLHKNRYSKNKSPLSEKEFRAILKARVLKEREETRLKLEAKGMRPDAFTNHTN